MSGDARALRIALIVPGFSSSESDWCVPALLDLVRSLSATCDVQVYALRYPHRRDTYSVDRATVTSFGAAQRRGLGRLVMLLRAARRIRRDARRRPFDLVHGLWAHEPGFLAAFLARRLGCAAVVSVMGGELVALPEISYGGASGLVNPRLIRFALTRATAVTVGSRYLDEIASGRVERARLLPAPLGVDSQRFSPSGSRDQSFSIPDRRSLLQVASLTPVKDQATLLRAFARILDSQADLHLHLVGEGPGRRSLERLTHRLEIDTRVTLHGALPHERLPAIYRTVDVLVQSSRFESQGMVVLEAAACGCPTVGTAVGILPELAPAEWLARPGDPDALSQAMLSALGDEHLRARAGKLRDRVSTQLTLESSCENLVALYRRAKRG